MKARMYEKAEKEGGYDSTAIVPTKKWSYRGYLDCAGSEDISTGLKTFVVEDLARVMKVVEELKLKLNHVRSMLSEMHPEVVALSEAIITLEQLVSQLRDEGIDNIVSEVVQEVLDEEGQYEEPMTDEYPRYEHGTYSVCTSSPPVGSNDRLDMVYNLRGPLGLKRKSDMCDADYYIPAEFPPVAELSTYIF